MKFTDLQQIYTVLHHEWPNMFNILDKRTWEIQQDENVKQKKREKTCKMSQQAYPVPTPNDPTDRNFVEQIRWGDGNRFGA